MNPVTGKSVLQQAEMNRCPQDLELFVQAVNNGQVHIVPTDFGYHVHIGDKKDMQSRAYGLMMSDVAISGNILLNCDDNWLTIGALKIPLKAKRIREALEFCKTTDYDIQADRIKKASVAVNKMF